MAKPRVAIVIGSKSDKEILDEVKSTLRKFGLSYEEKVLSAHRSPKLVSEYASSARKRGLEVIIAAAGKAAHLAGVIASYTTIPVIGIPVKTKDLGGLDSLLSTVQMPSGVPVATVAVDGAQNAAILAAEIVALKDTSIAKKLEAFKEELVTRIEKADEPK